MNDILQCEWARWLLLLCAKNTLLSTLSPLAGDHRAFVSLFNYLAEIVGFRQLFAFDFEIIIRKLLVYANIV